jgi:hypothetical protein
MSVLPMSLFRFSTLQFFLQNDGLEPQLRETYLGTELILIHILDLLGVQACSCRHPVLPTIS